MAVVVATLNSRTCPGSNCNPPLDLAEVAMVVATLSSRACPGSNCDPPPEMAEKAERVVGGSQQPLCEWLVVARGLSWLEGGVGKESPGCPVCCKCPG